MSTLSFPYLLTEENGYGKLVIGDEQENKGAVMERSIIDHGQ